MGSNTSYEDLGPGLHVLREAEPLTRAGSVAASLRADLCATLPQADTALDQRSRLPLVDATTLATLEGLARRIARAERIAVRTRERATIDVGQRLVGAGSGLAVHPDTIRERAAAVDTARAELAAAERALAEHEAAEAQRRDAEITVERPVSDVDGEAGEERADPGATSLRTRRTRAVGALVTTVGLGLVLLAVGTPLWAALLPVLAASMWAVRYLRPDDAESLGDPDDDEDRAEVAQLLAQISITTEEVFGPDPAQRAAEEQRSLLSVARDRAIEELRVAQRAWHELAGEEVGTDQLEQVVRRFDPQHEDAQLLAGETAGVRTAEAVLHRYQQRWLAFWRELGLDAPSPEAGEAAVQELSARVSRPVVLVGPATERAAALARVAPAAPVVVLDGLAEET